MHHVDQELRRKSVEALEYQDGFQPFTIGGDHEQRLMNMARAKRLLDWEPLARPLR